MWVVCRHHLFDYEDGSPAERMDARAPPLQLHVMHLSIYTCPRQVLSAAPTSPSAILQCSPVQIAAPLSPFNNLIDAKIKKVSSHNGPTAPVLSSVRERACTCAHMYRSDASADRSSLDVIHPLVFAGAGPIGQYYLRRIGRVAFMAWVSLIACMLIPAGTSSSGPGANGCTCFCMLSRVACACACARVCVRAFMPTFVHIHAHVWAFAIYASLYVPVVIERFLAPSRSAIVGLERGRLDVCPMLHSHAGMRVAHTVEQV